MTRTLRIDGISHAVACGGRERQALAPLTHSFRPGALHVIAGSPSGQKTSLLLILALTLHPQHGAVWWGESDLTRLAPASQARWRRAHIALISPANRLVSVMTVAEHVRLASVTKRGASTAASELSQLGLSGQLSALPDQLSEEQQRRVAIAQVLSARKPVLLANEPTASLDLDGALLVAAALRDFALNANAVVICASDDHALIDAADELLVLDDVQ